MRNAQRGRRRLDSRDAGRASFQPASLADAGAAQRRAPCRCSPAPHRQTRPCRIREASFRETENRMCRAPTNVLGITNPVQDMARAAHAAGARFFLDAAQSFAHLPVNVKELGADFVAFSAHKAYGPLGIGGLWISDEAFDEMDPVSIGGGSISHASLDSYYLRVGAIQYEVGTPPVSQAVGWAGAISYVETLGLNAIARHGRALTRYLVDGLHGYRERDGLGRPRIGRRAKRACFVFRCGRKFARFGCVLRKA